jgi:formiminotetrahydrofolate cyclodeaminase
MSVTTVERVTGGGPAAARTIGLAAEIVVTVARASRECWAEAPGVAAQAVELQERCPALALEDEHAWMTALAALGDAVDSSADGRGADLRAALAQSVELLVAIAEAGADTAELAALAARFGRRSYTSDAAAAALLAQASVRVARHLVGVNLATRADDELSTRASAAEWRAEQAVSQALEGAER